MIDVTHIQSLEDALRPIAEEMRSKDFFILLLSGTLGSGKTTSIRLLAEMLGVKSMVQSPTYTLIREYPLSTPANTLYHMDLYRLSSLEEIFEYGILDMLSLRKGIFCIEWPELLDEEIQQFGSNVRTLTLSFQDEQRMLEVA